jgi:hypothetical protein
LDEANQSSKREQLYPPSIRVADWTALWEALPVVPGESSATLTELGRSPVDWTR